MLYKYSILRNNIGIIMKKENTRPKRRYARRSKEDLVEFLKSKGYQTIKEFRSDEDSIYQYAAKRPWWPELKAEFFNFKWTEQSIRDLLVSKKYKTITEWSRDHYESYSIFNYNREAYNTLKAEFFGGRTLADVEALLTEKKYSVVREWHKYDQASYIWVRRNATKAEREALLIKFFPKSYL